ncbi:MAG: hypothetical protein ACTSRH_03395 [Promethearchaeota archaeon]
MEKFRRIILSIDSIESQQEIENLINNIVEESINYAIQIAESEEFFEAGEFLYSVASLIEELDMEKALSLYNEVNKYWEKSINFLRLQAKFHEIAQVYIRIADLQKNKFNNPKLERKNILNSINFLKQESKLLKEFGKNKTLAQNYQILAELYIRIADFKKAAAFLDLTIEIAKTQGYLDILSYSYQQIATCFKELDDYKKATEIILDGIEYFINLFEKCEEKNDYLGIAELSQVLKKMYQLINDEDGFVDFSKKEASAYINLAEQLEKTQENFQKIARYYRGAALCYQEINNNLIESASCFMLAGNYCEKIKKFEEAGLNFFNAAATFKELGNLEMAYKNYIKAGDNYWKSNNVNDSTESYLNAYDIAVDGQLEYNRFGLFNQIIRGLNKIAKNGLKNKQFYTAATLILESIKFYQELDTAKDFLVNEMVRNVYKYYYKAANLKKIGKSHIVQSYILAAISSILNGKIEKAKKILLEIEFNTHAVKKYKKFVNLIIEWVLNGEKVEFDKFPLDIQRLISGSEEILYLLKLFKGFKLKN